MPDKFTNIELIPATTDLYWVRNSIFEAIKTHAPDFQGKLLDVGCGQMPYRNWITENTSITTYIGLDLEGNKYSEQFQPDLLWDGSEMPLENASIDTGFSTEVLEHVPTTDIFLKEIHRVLKPGGVFFFTVPYLWPLHDKPHDEYRFTPFSLRRHLQEAGFQNEKIELQALGGWDASLAQMLGLWVNRRSMSPRKRKWLRKIVFPVYNRLIRKDVVKARAEDEVMLTGICGVCKK
jgi:SAM-dependent methyltransferase